MRTDERGCRGVPQPDTRSAVSPDPLVVLALGDSLTFGEGVEDHETWPAQLEALLATELAPRAVRVVNAGVAAYGPQEARVALRELAPAVRPDVVLCQFAVANDALDGLRWRDAPGPLRVNFGAAEALEHHLLLTNLLARWSRAYRLAVWRWGRHAIRYRFMMAAPQLERAATLLEQVGATARELLGAEVRFGVLVAPNVAQVERSPAEWALGTERLHHGVLERLAARDVPACHPLDALRAADTADAPTYYEVERYWTAAGHRAVAEALVPFVRGLLEPRAAPR